MTDDASRRASILLRTASQLMAPLARLLVANGVTYTMFARALKPVFLQAAERELQSEGKRITDSALSLLSGVHRKDVRTLTADAQPAKRTVTIASQVTMAWTSQPEYLDADGHPRPLPMRAADADAPSFERLSQTISKDFHARSVLDELTRLGVVEERDGMFQLVLAEGFVPAADLEEVARYLGANVGDHLAATAANFGAAHKGQRSPYLEFALWGDELSSASVVELQKLAQQQWMNAMKKVRNAAETRSEQDRAALSASELHRFRFGVYFYHDSGYEPLAGDPDAAEAASAASTNSLPGQPGGTPPDGQNT